MASVDLFDDGYETDLRNNRDDAEIQKGRFGECPEPESNRHALASTRF
jgi:hypothetical protein